MTEIGTPRLEVSDLTVAYGGTTAVRDFSLQLVPGSCLGIVGANGAGKSSLLRCVGGVVRPLKGQIRVDGVEIANRQASSVARLGVRLVPESRELFWSLTVEENLRLGAGGGRHVDAIDMVVDIFPALRKLWQRQARWLSGGEQQMLAIGRTLASRPKLLMLDEPSLGLAPIVVTQLIQALHVVRSAGVSLLIAEQTLRIPRELCDEVILCRLGRAVAQGIPAVALEPAQLRAAFLGVAT